MSYKFETTGLPLRWSDTAGLRYRSYSVYSGSASDSPDPASLLSGSLRTVSGSSNQISNFAVGNDTTYVWRGYFHPDQDSANWRFRVTSEDGAYLWLDTNAEAAVASLDRSNAIVDNGGTHGSQTVTSGDQNLDADYHYAITLVAGSTGGAGTATLEWSPDGGSNWYTSGADFLSHDSRYVDGFGVDLYTNYPVLTANWVVAFDTGTGDVGYAANSDRTSWTIYDRVSGNGAAYDGAYGKDGSGNGIYIISNASATGELTVSSDNVTDGAEWSRINIPGDLDDGNRFHSVCWGNDSSNSTSGVWLAGNSGGKVYRSTNGASSFSEATLASQTTSIILSIAGNGSGKFVTGQDNRLLISTNDGASFSSSTPFTAEDINGVAYTNSTWIVTYTKNSESNLFARTAADSDLTTWSSEVDLGISKPNNADGTHDPGPRANIAAASGRVLIAPNKRSEIARLDVNGTTTSNLANATYPTGPASETRILDITTDGSTWMAVTTGGNIYESTDNGETFSEIVDNIYSGTANSGTDIQVVVASSYLPL